VRNAIIKALTKGVEYGTILSMAGMTILLLVNVFLRYLFSRPFPWAEEISVLLIVWVVFLGAGLVQKKDEHVAVTYLFDLFPLNEDYDFISKPIYVRFGSPSLSAINLLKVDEGKK
jgi:TRAP-type C4-dicarboxylate transport system permease small subunit